MAHMFSIGSTLINLDQVTHVTISGNKTLAEPGEIERIVIHFASGADAVTLASDPAKTFLSYLTDNGLVTS